MSLEDKSEEEISKDEILDFIAQNPAPSVEQVREFVTGQQEYFFEQEVKDRLEVYANLTYHLRTGKRVYSEE